MEQEAKEIGKLKEDVSNLKEVVENITTLLNRKLINELYEEAKKIEEGEYYTEEEFKKRHNIKAL